MDELTGRERVEPERSGGFAPPGVSAQSAEEAGLTRLRAYPAHRAWVGGVLRLFIPGIASVAR
jgi:hypothetical protein